MPLLEVSDKVLIKRAIKHDKHAYAQLVRRYQSQLRHSLRQLCNGDTEAAEDMAQEAFIRAYRALPSFKGNSSFPTWLYKIAHNITVSYFRINRLVINQEIVDAEMQSLETTDKPYITRDIDKALDQLNVDEKKVIHLTLDVGFSHSETAEILGLPLGTVKSHVLRAKKKLQNMLGKLYEEECS